MNDRPYRKPTEEIRQWADELFDRNERTRGAVAGEMYLGRDVLVVELRRPVVIEGQWADVAAKTPTDEEDLFDLMDAYARERGW